MRIVLTALIGSFVVLALERLLGISYDNVYHMIAHKMAIFSWGVLMAIAIEQTTHNH